MKNDRKSTKNTYDDTATLKGEGVLERHKKETKLTRCLVLDILRKLSHFTAGPRASRTILHTREG